MRALRPCHRCNRQISRRVRTRVQALVFAASFVLAGAAMAKPPPASGLRVVWVRELPTGPGAPSIAPGSDVRVQPSPGLWPRVERVRGPVAEIASSPALDVRGRRLPAVSAGRPPVD